MAFVAAKCTQCGANIEVDDCKEKGRCGHCGTTFVTTKAINNYHTHITQNITQHFHMTAPRTSSTAGAPQHADKATYSDKAYLKAAKIMLWFNVSCFLSGLLLVFTLLFTLCIPPMRDSKIAQDSRLEIVQAQLLAIESGPEWESRYRISYSYEHNGQTLTMQTKNLYSLETATRYEQQGYVEVRVSQNGRAVDIHYRARFSSGYATGWFGVSCGLLLIAFFSVLWPKSFIHFKSLSRIIKRGKTGTGVFVESKRCYTLIHGANEGFSYRRRGGSMRPGNPNDTMHKIRFTYTDGSNQEHTVWSKRPYTLSAVNAAKAMRRFPIKYYGGEAIVEAAALNELLQK
ncbi:MAG: hypothetical protein FWH03_04620 [Firmicutes bacterium]|nr:hypothetical protein [Bacillota bacterium]